MEQHPWTVEALVRTGSPFWLASQRSPPLLRLRPPWQLDSVRLVTC
jgi:hypothetical protein